MEYDLVRNIRLGTLLDHYGACLTPRQRRLLSLHAEEDLSLAEIAEQEGVSRQAVHDALKRGTTQLEDLERKLRLAARTEAARRAGERLSALEANLQALPEELEAREALLAEAAALRRLWEEIDGV